MLLEEWAGDWGISKEALVNLRLRMNAEAPAAEVPEGASEAWAQQQVRLEACSTGARLWRNNVGVLVDDRGVPVRFGLANDSKAMNSSLKSSDLIGITPRLVTYQDVGRHLGVFTSIEMKRPGWKYTGKGREVAQRAWLDLVVSMGGIGKFSTGGL